MLTPALLLLGAVLLALVLADRAVRRLPLTPALIYLAAGAAAGGLLGAPTAADIVSHTHGLAVVTELALLGSLFAVGMRLGASPGWQRWRVPLLLAGPGVVVAIASGTVLAVWCLGMPWPIAMVLATVMAPTDPVLASEVQIRSDEDRDAVRLSLTAEGGLNDSSALPAMMLALGLLGLHPLGDGGLLASPRWWWMDLVWPIGGGAVLGVLLGNLLGRALRSRSRLGDLLARDELLYVGAVTLAWGLARLTHTSAFVLVFMLGVWVLGPLREHAKLAAKELAAKGNEEAPGDSLWTRMHWFGARSERLVEAVAVLAVGVALHSTPIGWRDVLYGLLLVGVVRPLSVWAVVRKGRSVTRSQRRLMAWFGIRGVGSLYYLAYAMEKGVAAPWAERLIGVVLTGIALSIVLHGVSATPLMARYQQRRQHRRQNQVP
jgi:sodium/hydrogen antiporter